jgi:hypothetical protein
MKEKTGLERSKRFLSYAWVRKPASRCCRLLDDRLIQIRPGNLKAIADTLGLSSNYGQTSLSILTLLRFFDQSVAHICQ